MKIRLQKFLSNAGVTSRRNAEEYIKNGEIIVNDKIATIGDLVDEKKDIVKFNGKKIEPTNSIYILFNKPKGYITTRSNFHKEKSVYDLIPKEYRKSVWPVGRLDKDTSGLLLFTNDGELTQKITHPSYEHEKEYEATSRFTIKPELVRELKRGVTVGNESYKLKKVSHKGKILNIILTEGKKRHIRIMCKEVGIQVQTLRRIRIGKLHLPENLKIGSYVLINKDKI